MTSSDASSIEKFIADAATSIKAVNSLLSYVDERTSALAWDDLLSLRQTLKGPLLTTPQLAPVQSRIEYRLALLADAPIAASMLADNDPRVAHGPLTEVIATNHTWAELAPQIENTAIRSAVAYERVLHGEDLDGDPAVDLSMFDLPLSLQDWEPDDYPLAIYTADGAVFPLPKIDDGSFVDLTAEPELTSDLTSIAALTELTRPWAEDSNGVSDAVVVKGEVMDAIGAFGWNRARIVAIDHTDALALMAWAAASGGAYGPRRGASAGRFSAWWTVAALSGLTEDWPVDPGEIGDAAQNLRWYAWEADMGDGKPTTPWRLQLAAADPEYRLAWAVSAIDLTDDALDDAPWRRLTPRTRIDATGNPDSADSSDEDFD